MTLTRRAAFEPADSRDSEPVGWSEKAHGRSTGRSR
jgi:hypothetical protein